MKIKILPADTLFSRYIRSRDKRCVRCGSAVQFNESGQPITHQASHFWGRGNWSTRFDPLNVDTLCFYCHRLWGSDYREEYRKFKLKQLGKKEYQDLDIRAHLYSKKDPKLALIYVKALIKT